MSTSARAFSTSGSGDRATSAGGVHEGDREPCVSSPRTDFDEAEVAESLIDGLPIELPVGPIDRNGESEWFPAAVPTSSRAVMAQEPIALLVRNPRHRLSTIIVRDRSPGSRAAGVPSGALRGRVSERTGSGWARAIDRLLCRADQVAARAHPSALPRVAFGLTSGFALGLLATAAVLALQPVADTVLRRLYPALWVARTAGRAEAAVPVGGVTKATVEQLQQTPVRAPPTAPPALSEPSPSELDEPSITSVTQGMVEPGAASPIGGRHVSRVSGGTASTWHRRLRRAMLREYRTGHYVSVVRLGRALRHSRALDDPEALFALGQAQRRTGLVGESVATYRELFESFPDHRHANNSLYWAAHGEQVLGNLGEARSLYRRVALGSHERWRRLAVRQLAAMP